MYYHNFYYVPMFGKPIMSSIIVTYWRNTLNENICFTRAWKFHDVTFSFTVPTISDYKYMHLYNFERNNFFGILEYLDFICFTWKKASRYQFIVWHMCRLPTKVTLNMKHAVFSSVFLINQSLVILRSFEPVPPS